MQTVEPGAAGTWSTWSCWSLVRLELLEPGPPGAAETWSAWSCWTLVRLELLLELSKTQTLQNFNPFYNSVSFLVFTIHIGGRVVSSHRSKLNPDTIEALMCLQDWLRTDLKGSLDDICFFTQNEDVDCDEDNNSEVFL
ncbi:hypothetical protein SLA2020_192510 [Shorea laevis]